LTLNFDLELGWSNNGNQKSGIKQERYVNELNPSPHDLQVAEE